MSDKMQITICGGGNGAHCFAGVTAARKKYRVHWLTMAPGEADKIVNNQKRGPLAVEFKMEKQTLGGKIDLVTDKPELAIPNSDMVILCLPAFAHFVYLDVVSRYLSNPATIVVFPSGAGLELEYISYFSRKESLTKPQDHFLINALNLPWAARLVDYGKRVEVLGVKAQIDLCVSGDYASVMRKGIIDTLQHIVGDRPKLLYDPSNHIVSSSLGYVNGLVHTPIMFSQWKYWDDNADVPLKEPPLFYEGLSHYGAAVMKDMCAEVLQVCRAISSRLQSPCSVKVTEIEEWYRLTYGKDCADSSSLRGLITTCPGYLGLRHPCLEVNGGYVPNFGYRYLAEDVPFGLLCMKGYALLAGVETPVMDELIRWAERVMKKDYLGRDGQLTGKDVKNTRTPQKYGITSMDTILELFPASKTQPTMRSRL